MPIFLGQVKVVFQAGAGRFRQAIPHYNKGQSRTRRILPNYKPN